MARKNKDPVSTAAAILGRRGGQTISDAKARASRANGKKGGWWSHKDNLPAMKKQKPR